MAAGTFENDYLAIGQKRDIGNDPSFALRAFFFHGLLLSQYIVTRVAINAPIPAGMSKK